MRISDWSSDVCSSDLLRHREKAVIGRIEQSNHEQGRCPSDDLREDLTARSPDYRAAHAAPERLGAFLICADAPEFRGFTHHFVLLARVSTGPRTTFQPDERRVGQRRGRPVYIRLLA